MTNKQQAIQKLNNALSAYRGSNWRMPDGTLKPMHQPQPKAWARVERWVFRCRHLGIHVPEIKP